MNKDRIKYLLDQQAEQFITDSERQELEKALYSEEQKELFHSVLKEWIDERAVKHEMPELSGNEVLQAIFQSGDQQIAGNRQAATPFRRRVHFIRAAWFRNIAAAVLIMAAGVAVFFWKQPAKPAVVKVTSVTGQNDVQAPAVNRAMITLANGQQIFLDSAGNGNLASEGNVLIQKNENGQIIYNETGNATETQYNTLTVPRGSQIAKLILADGSRVFVNAASSITYPVAFLGNERKVEITGEAYFEVAKDPKKKFIVSSNGITTEVLGTHFNVNTYADESSAKITLIEGKVLVKRAEEQMMIKPGEQVECAPQDKLTLHPHADISQVMAWQRGMFLFTDMSLPAILRQVSRWYDVTVKYEGVLPVTSFGGGLSRNLPLSEAIKLLESDKIKFTLTGNTLSVQSK